MPVADPTGKAAVYRRGLDAYREALSGLEAGVEADDRRIEHQFECLRDWSLHHTLAEIEDWFRRQRETCPMQVDDIPLNETQGWIIDPDTGDVRHESGEFFTVHGVRVSQTDAREVGAKGWDQPILTQVGYDGGLLGIVRQRHDGVPHYLIEAKAEPGNYERIQMSPSLQATFSNLKRAHKGRKPRFAEIFEEPDEHGGKVLYKQWLSEDGGRLHKKRNMGMMVEVPPDRDIEPADGFIWMSMYQIKACLHQNAWVNPHIRGIIAHL